MLGSLSSKSSSKKKKKTINSFEAFTPEINENTIDSLDVFKPKGNENTTDGLDFFRNKPKENTIDSLDMFKPKNIGNAALEQVKPTGDWAKDWLGLGEKSGQEVNMQPGVAYSPSQIEEAKAAQEQAEKSAEAPKEAAIEYAREIVHVGESRKENQESSQKIQMLIQELQRLAQSVQAIEKAMILQAIDPSAGTKTGKYYENFFEWMLTVVQDARRKVEDSGAWLSAMSSKKKPGIHQQMKTNMKIAMSGERTNANNTG